MINITRNLSPILKAATAVGITGLAIGKLVVGSKIAHIVLLNNFIPPGVSCITLFFISFLPGFATISASYGLQENPRKILTPRMIFTTLIPCLITNKIALGAGVALTNAFLLSTLSIGVTYFVVQPLVYVIINAARERLIRHAAV